jgi:putative MATE family efflux protein
MKRDLTTGSIVSHIFSMSLPTMAGLMFQGLYDLVDMIWIGQLSYESVAAVTIFISIFWLFEVLNEIIGMSSVSLISQSFGAGNIDRARRASEQALTLKLIIAAIAALIMYTLLEPMVRLFTDDDAVVSLALEYGRVRTIFMPMFFSSFSVNTIFRCTGDAKTPMYLLIGSALLNIILDPLLMFDVIPGTSLPGLGLGMRGAAIATVVSYTAAFVTGFLLLLRGRAAVTITLRGMLHLDKGISKKLLTIGLPSGIEMLFRNAANSIMIILVGTYGTAAVALIGVGAKLQSFMFMPILGIMMGSGTIAGQNLGAGQIDRAAETARYSSLIGAAVTSVFVLFIALFPERILLLFLSDFDEIRQGVIMLRIIPASLIIASVSLGLAAVFSGSGYVYPFLTSCIVGKWIVMLPYVYVTVSLLSLDLRFVWYSFLIGEAVELFIISHYYRRGDWKSKRV